jgi:hypothetical protein
VGAANTFPRSSLEPSRTGPCTLTRPAAVGGGGNGRSGGGVAGGMDTQAPTNQCDRLPRAPNRQELRMRGEGGCQRVWMGLHAQAGVPRCRVHSDGGTQHTAHPNPQAHTRRTHDLTWSTTTPPPPRRPGSGMGVGGRGLLPSSSLSLPSCASSSDHAGAWWAEVATSAAVRVVEGATKASVLAVATVGRKNGASGASCSRHARAHTQGAGRRVCTMRRSMGRCEKAVTNTALAPCLGTIERLCRECTPACASQRAHRKHVVHTHAPRPGTCSVRATRRAAGVGEDNAAAPPPPTLGGSAGLLRC